MKNFRLLGLFGFCCLASMAFAGWTHFNGKTFFVPDPTPATIWTRFNQTGDLYLLRPNEVQVFDNTIRFVTGTVQVVSYGYWSIDANDDYILMAGDQGLYDNRFLPSAVRDVEFEVNANGDFIPKE